MSNSTWRKRIEAIWNRFYFYPAPDPMPHTRLFWIAMGLVTFFVLLFSGFFILFLTSRHNAYLTGAEDLGIMDQAIWSLTHGQLFHQTICNVVSDTNCYTVAGISRFAIHFEPILFPVSLFYLILPNPNTLLVIQTLVVASGAFPAFWLARLRLRNELAAVGIALLYLLYPAQQQATIFDFHAVTFTAALLLFTLYFMYTRRTVWLFVFAILSMACKEEIPVVIALFGLWSILFQHQWRTGAILILLAIGWLGLVFLSFHFFSPTGHPLLASRYAYLGNSPLAIVKNIVLHPVSLLKEHVLDASHREYLRLLLAPASFLPLLAPWVLVLAVPSMALNLFSSDPGQYTGLFQYNAEIVPVLIFATIEALVLILWLVQWGIKRYSELSKKSEPAENQNVVADKSAMGTRELKDAPQAPLRPLRFVWARPVLLGVLISLLLLNIIRLNSTLGTLPYSQGFQWPESTPHNELAQRFTDMIPQTASVSAQSSLVPHISHRSNIYLFPYADDRADYIFLDVTGYTYPYLSYPYNVEVKQLLLSGKYGVEAAQDGYLLLKRGWPPPGISPNTPSVSVINILPNLPDAFCSFVRVSPKQVTHPLQVDFTTTDDFPASISLIGFSIAAPNTFTVSTRYMQITAYWRVNTPNPPPLQLFALLIGKNGSEEYLANDFPAITWCPTNTWKPGTVLETTSRTLFLGNVPIGLAHVAIALLPLADPFDTISTIQDWLPLHIVSAPNTVTPVKNTNALQLETITIVP